MDAKREVVALRSEHRARIVWSDSQVLQGLPTLSETIDPSWFEGDLEIGADGWSLVCRFDSPPSQQGNPSTARISFMVEDAPHERLRAGTRLRLFERKTGTYALVEVLD